MQGYCVIYLASYLRFGDLLHEDILCFVMGLLSFLLLQNPSFSALFHDLYSVQNASGIFILSSFCVSII